MEGVINDISDQAHGGLPGLKEANRWKKKLGGKNIRSVERTSESGER